MGEVEDARGLVGENQPDSGQAVDRPDGDPDDDEGQYAVYTHMTVTM